MTDLQLDILNRIDEIMSVIDKLIADAEEAFGKDSPRVQKLKDQRMVLQTIVSGTRPHDES